MKNTSHLMTTSTDSQRGFTAIEVLIGLTIALIVLAGVMSLYVSTVRGNSTAYQQAEATSLSRGVLEDLRALTVDEIVTEYGALPIAREPLPVTTERGVDYTPYLTVEEVATDTALVRVRVEVEWTELGAEPGTGRDHALRTEVIRNKVDLL